MSHDDQSIQYGEHTIAYTVVRRPRKTLEIAVEPDTSVVVTAPEDASLEAIEGKLRKRAAWVMRQKRHFSAFLPRTPQRLYISGETHLYLGRQYRLKVVPHIQRDVKLYRGRILVQTHHPKSPDVTQEMVEGWYREKALAKFPERIEESLKPAIFAERGSGACLMARRRG